MDALLSLWAWLVDGHSGLTLAGYCLNALFGLIGAATSVFALNPSLRLPRLEEDGDLEVGALGFLLVGVGAAVGVGHSTVVPFLAGLVGPVLVPFLLNEILPLALRALKPLLSKLLPREETDKEKKTDEA